MVAPAPFLLLRPLGTCRGGADVVFRGLAVTMIASGRLHVSLFLSEKLGESHLGAICGILRYLVVLLSQAILTANIHGDYAGSMRGFTESFHNETASSVVALSDHVRDHSVLAA